ncbi:MAG: helix-turn-helix domain-containing protein [Cyanobacteria bacterium SIG28]|nr:helix-turn-helix domain-containing protein [Cyanobacteria bacterium SIG28]
MPNYLTKEEIRQWRSSLEKITLEEFAARLGKSVEESKPTNDLVDIVMSKGTSSNTNHNISDGFSAIAERAFKRERQISHTPFSISKKEMVEDSSIAKKSPKKEESIKSIVNKALKTDKKSDKLVEAVKEDSLINKAQELSSQNEINIVLKKSLTDREQLVFEYFLNNINKTVFAKDLAELLELPRDYVYKYIKNLRAKIEGDKLKNVPSGGFILSE